MSTAVAMPAQHENSAVAAKPAQGEKAAVESKPAKTRSYERLYDLPLGVDEYSSGEKHFNRAPAHVIVDVVAGICKVLWRYKVVGIEKLDALAAKSGVVVVSNHTSYLDVVFMYLSMRGHQWPRFIARESLMNKHAALGWILAHVGAFPIQRDSADRTAIKRAAKMLKNGEVVGIMPEGSRRGKSATPPRVHGGAALIARMGKAPILPMGVRNVDKIKRKGERLRFPKVTVVYGDPLYLEQFDFLPKDERLDGCVWYALRECFALFKGVAPEEVDMAALFPEDKDYTAVFAEHPIEPPARP